MQIFPAILRFAAPPRTWVRISALLAATLGGTSLAAQDGLAPDGSDSRPVIAGQDSEQGPFAGLKLAKKLGLAYRTPPGARAMEQRNQQGLDALLVTDDNDPPGWTITFQRLEAPELGDTATTKIDSFLEKLGNGESRPTDERPTVRSRETLGIRLLGGTEDQRYPAELIYLDVPLKSDRGISGLLVIQTEPNAFLYGTLFAMAEPFESGGEDTLKALFESLRIEPATGRKQSEMSRIEQGAAILDRFTPDVLRAIGNQPVNEFYRIYSVDQDGAITEVGWQQMTTSLAPMSAIEGTKSGEDVASSEGLMVTLKGEIVEFFESRKITIDSLANHWISLDRSQARWSIIRTPRRILQIGGNRTESEVGSPNSETGIRTPPQPRSMVMVMGSEGQSQRLELPPAPAPFLDQTEIYVLGRLLEASGIESFEADWYVLDQRAESGFGIMKRSDGIVPDGDDGSSKLETIGSRGRSTQFFDAAGARTRLEKTMPDGKRLIFELTDPESLIDIYTQKNLPVR